MVQKFSSGRFGSTEFTINDNLVFITFKSGLNLNMVAVFKGLHHPCPLSVCVTVPSFQGHLCNKVAVHLEAQMPRWAAYSTCHNMHTHTLWSPVVRSVSALGQSFHATFPPILQLSATNPSFWTHNCTLCKHSHTHTLTYTSLGFKGANLHIFLHSHAEMWSLFFFMLFYTHPHTYLPCGTSVDWHCCPLSLTVQETAVQADKNPLVTHTHTQIVTVHLESCMPILTHLLVLGFESVLWWAEQTSDCAAELQAKRKKTCRHTTDSSKKLAVVALVACDIVWNYSVCLLIQSQIWRWILFTTLHVQHRHKGI